MPPIPGFPADLFTSALLQRLKLRHKIAALGVIGMSLSTLPLIQLLRFQALELQSAQADEDQLEPAVLAVELQRGLVDHRASAAHWLQGRRDAEVPRRQHQAAVDTRLARLDHRLESGGQAQAQQEVTAMRGDWRALVKQVVQHQCSVADSDRAHRLLVEQVLQVIDYVTVASAQQPDAARLRVALAAARRQLQPGQGGAVDLPAAVATLTVAQTQVQAAQSRRLALHQAGFSLAAAGLLALVVGVIAGLAWLRVAAQRTSLAPSPPSRPPEGWRMSPPDGQQSARSARHGLLNRLRRPLPAAPRLDQPTEPHDP